MIKIPPRKILVVKLGSIGDVVNTLPLVNILKDSWPQSELAWLIEPKSYPLVEGHSEVDRFIVFQRHQGISPVFRALREIRDFHPDLVIDLQRILRSAFFTFFSGCPLRLGFNRERSKEFSWLFTNIRIPPADPNRHMVWQYLDFAAYLGLECSSPEFRLPITEEDRKEAKRLLNPVSLHQEIIALNIGAAKPANRWPEKHWVQLIRLLLQKTPFHLVLTGGKQDAKRGRLVLERLGGEEKVRNLIGLTSLKQLGGLFCLMKTVVSGDTGPMHIASALGTRTIGLFGPANPRRTGPFNHLNLVIDSRVDCPPRVQKRYRLNKCMEDIAPKIVFDKIFPSKIFPEEKF